MKTMVEENPLFPQFILWSAILKWWNQVICLMWLDMKIFFSLELLWFCSDKNSKSLL